jgi:hypothetical protein
MQREDQRGGLRMSGERADGRTRGTARVVKVISRSGMGRPGIPTRLHRRIGVILCETSRYHQSRWGWPVAW